MPERQGSADSFDDFFGEAKPKNDDEVVTKSSAQKPKQDATPTSSTVATLVKTQPVLHHHQTPSSSSTTAAERPPLPTPVVLAETKPKMNSTKAPVTTTITVARKTIKETPTSLPTMSNRADSVQSHVYESDFDDDNEYDGDDTEIEAIGDDKGARDSKKHSSLPPPKERVVTTPRRGSDSELRATHNVVRHRPLVNGNAKRKDRFLPYIRQHQPKGIVHSRPIRNHPQRRQKETPPPSSKNEIEQRLLSAQQNKLKFLESRLNEVRQELEAQRIENATLRTIQRREEKALKKYEDQEYDVHRIVKDYSSELEYVKEVLSTERQTKAKLEKQVDARDEKLRDQTKRMRHYEKLVQDKNLDERYEVREKLNDADKRLQELQEKMTVQEKYIENLEKNHRHEINQELLKQRDLKRDLEKRTQNYDDLRLKFEEKTRQMDTMHIYIQRGGHRPSDLSTHLSKSHSLQSLQETSPRFREKINEYDKKRREHLHQEKKSKPSTSNDSSPKHEKKKALPPPAPVVPKREQQQTTTTTVAKPSSTSHLTNGEKPSTVQNGHSQPKAKPPARRLSTPKSIDEDKSDFDDESVAKTPPSTIQRGEQHLSHAQIHQRPPVLEPPSKSKQTSSGTGSNTGSSLFKLTEPPPLKTRPTRDLDEKWSDMFNTSKKEEPAKEDLLAKLVSVEQEERRTATVNHPPRQPPPMSTFESSTNDNDKKPTTYKSSATPNHYDFDQAIINMHEGKPSTAQPTTTAKSVADPFESLFSGSAASKPAPRTNGLDDIFSTKSTTQPTTQPKSDMFDSLFGPTAATASTTATTTKPNSKQLPSQNDKLQRPKVVTNATRTIPNRTVVEEVEEFVL